MPIEHAGFHTLARRAGALLKDARARQVFANNLLKEFSYTHGLLKTLGHPRIYQLETTNYCPYTCNMCPRTHAMTRELGHMDIGLFRAILDQIEPAWQVDGVTEDPYIALWHFGEPMVYKHFAEAVSYSHRRGLRVIISTNPSVWTTSRIEEILELGLDEMYVMMDGMDDSTSMAIRGRAASFARGDANVRQLLERKANLGLNRPLIHMSMIKQPRNAHQWNEFQTYWKGVEGIESVILGDFSTFAGDIPGLVQIQEALISQHPEEAISVARHQRLLRLPCFYPWHSITVTWRGEAVPCCRDHNGALVLGDLTKQSLESVWNGSAMQDLRRQFKTARVTAAPCSTCKERSNEIGLPGRYYPFSLVNARRALAKAVGQSFP